MEEQDVDEIWKDVFGTDPAILRSEAGKHLKFELMKQGLGLM